MRKELALADTNKPAILLEVCFVSSTVDVELYKKNFEAICQAIAKELAAHIGYKINTDNKDENKENGGKSMPTQSLNDTGRKEIRALLKKARNKTYTINDEVMPVIDPEIHTDAKIASYTDEQLLSYQAAVINRTF